ncbi:MAG TPA: hypothetical protein VIJ00_18690 [Nakamurella sp.]
MTPASRHGVRGRWLVLGVILWLILASSITLEQGQESAAQWGSAATLAVIGILVLLAVCRVALIPVRGLVRRVRRWVAGRFR